MGGTAVRAGGAAAFGAALLAGMLAATPGARANDASYFGDGATVYAGKDPRVRMASERVVVRPVAADRRQGSGDAWEVDATFVLRNLTDGPVTLQVGHPDWRTWGDVGVAGDGEFPWALRDFRAFVEGRPVEARHRDAGEAPPGLRVAAGREGPPWEGAWTFDVAFPPGGEVTVRNTYRFGGLHSNGPWSACVGDRPHRAARRAFWRHARVPRGGWDFADGACSTVRYVVTSGRSWAGTIGEAEITFELPPDAAPHLFVPVPEAAEVRPGRVTWRFRDWTPTRELAVHFLRPLPGDGPAALPAFDTASQARAWAAWARANGADGEFVRRARDWIRAAREGRFDDPAVAPFAAANGWYLSDRPPAVPADAGETRRILQALDRLAAPSRRAAPPPAD